MQSIWKWTGATVWTLTVAACGSSPQVIDPVADAGPVADAAVVDTGVGNPLDSGIPDYEERFTGGAFHTLPDGTTLGYAALAGWAGVVVQTTGKSDVLIEVSGLTPMTVYTAHVHGNQCDTASGGPHYKIDPAVADTVESNELWVTIMSDANGVGTGTLRSDHYARPDARSVVIHEPGTGERITCATLYPNADVVARGDFALLPDGAGQAITGTATLRRYAGGTVARIRLEGTFASAEPYPAHVHAKACNDEAGGPHYKINPLITDTVQNNEIWIDGQHNGALVEGVTAITHLARYDAWSVVVHDPATNNRLLCADLRW